MDLDKPLLTLADLVREGGNIGAHFDHERDADREMAEAVIDLIEYLVEYVYTLPGMIDRLSKQLKSGDQVPLDNLSD